MKDATEQAIETQAKPDSIDELPYEKQLKHRFMQVIKSLNLEDRQRFFLEHRWLDQVLWMEKKASECRDRHTRLKLTAIILSVVTPILVGANTFWSSETRRWEPALKTAALVVSSTVAIAGSIDEFFSYGKRWYAYRQSVESLKSEGWQFFELTGSYNAHKTHTEAFPAFVFQVEETIRRDVNLFATQQQSKHEENGNSEIPLVQSDSNHPPVA